MKSLLMVPLVAAVFFLGSNTASAQCYDGYGSRRYDGYQPRYVTRYYDGGGYYRSPRYVRRSYRRSYRPRFRRRYYRRRSYYGGYCY